MKKMLLLLVFASACDQAKPSIAPPTSDLGTGLNTVERRIARPVPEVLKAAGAAARALGLKIESEKSDALGGEIQARRATDDRVVIVVKSADAEHASVSVRVAPGDRNMSNAVHEKIAAELGVPGGTGEEGETETVLYSQKLAACVAAAEKALKELNYAIADRQAGEETAELKGRAEDLSPAWFRFRKATDGRTEATISCGIGKGAPARERVRLLKAEFERAFAPVRDN